MKRYTSGSMTIRPMYCKPSNITPTAKLVSTCNEVQALADASSACSDRLLVFRFDRELPKEAGSTSDEKMTVAYWSHPDRRSGILSWLVDGLERLRRRGKFDVPEEVTVWKREAEQEADQFIEQLLARVIKEPESFITNEELKAELPELPRASSLSKYIARFFPEAVSTVRKTDHKSVRGWKGLAIKG